MTLSEDFINHKTGHAFAFKDNSIVMSFMDVQTALKIREWETIINTLNSLDGNVMFQFDGKILTKTQIVNKIQSYLEKLKKENNL